MKFLFTLLILTITLVACKKNVKYNKQIDGTWNPVTIKISDESGIGYYAASEGIISFQKDGKKSATGTYTIKLNYVLKGTPYTFLEEGTYSLEENYMQRTTSTELVNKAIINYVNKEDLEFEIPNLDNRRFLMVLKRQD